MEPVILVCSSAGWDYRVVQRCPVCKTRRRQVVLAQPYYPFEVVCCACGTRFTEDGWRRGSDAKARRAKERWKAARPWKCMAEDHRRYLDGEPDE